MNKTIKIIDLLNKIANGEKVPEKIRYDDIIWTIDYAIGDYYRHINTTSEWLCEKYSVKRSIRGFINDTVEIIEDNDKLEKMQDFDLTLKETNVTKDLELTYEGVSKTFNYAWHKIDGIIDHINKIEEKLDE